MRRGWDVSNWTGAPDARWDALNQSLDGNERGVLFVQSIDPPAGYPPGVTQQQIQWGLDNGWDVVAYLWKWFELGLDDTQRKLDLISPFTGRLLALANDVEDTTISPLAALEVGGGVSISLPPEHVKRIGRQPRPTPPAAAAVAALSLQARLDQLSALFQLTDQFPTILGSSIGGSIYYGGRWYHVPYLGNSTMLAERGYRVWLAQYDGIYDVAVVTLFGGWTPDSVVAKQPQGTTTVGGDLGNVDPDVCADVLAQPTPPTPPAPTDDPAWVAKKPLVIQLAGELLAVADQLDEAADQPGTVHQLADGVRDRAGEILD